MGKLSTVKNKLKNGLNYILGAEYSDSRSINKELDKRLDDTPIEEIKKDFENIYKGYRLLQKKWEPNGRLELLDEKVTNKKELDGLIDEIKKTGYKPTGEFILLPPKRKFSFSTKRKNFIVSGTKYEVMHRVLHENLHCDGKIRFGYNPTETEVELCALDLMQDTTRNTVGEIYTIKERLCNVLEAYRRKVEKDDVGPEEVKLYLGRFVGDTDRQAKDYISKQMSSHKIIKLSRKDRRDFRYNSDAYILSKAKGMKEGVTEAIDRICSGDYYTQAQSVLLLEPVALV